MDYVRVADTASFGPSSPEYTTPTKTTEAGFLKGVSYFQVLNIVAWHANWTPWPILKTNRVLIGA